MVSLAAKAEGRDAILGRMVQLNFRATGDRHGETTTAS